MRTRQLSQGLALDERGDRRRQGLHLEFVFLLAFPLDGGLAGRGHHLVGHAVGFLLIHIPGWADHELGLEQALHGAVAISALQGQDVGRRGGAGVDQGALDRRGCEVWPRGGNVGGHPRGP